MAKGKYQEWLTKDGLLLLESYARDGLNDDQIAQKMGINRSTYYRWQVENKDIRDAIKRGKAPVDIAVENALYKSAMGFTKKVRKPIKLRQRGGAEVVEYVEEEIYVPPQVTAQIFWLKNRKPNKWRDKPDDIGTGTPVTVIIDV